MAQITASLVKELREKSGAGMMDCKKALAENDGDIDAAVDWLRTKGLAAAAKKAGRTAADGLVGVAVGDKAAALVEVNAETDFVARNEIFQGFVRTLAGIVLEQGDDIEALAAAAYPETGRTVSEQLTHNIATIGENMSLRRAQRVTVENGAVASYVHNAVADGLGKVGVLVAVETGAAADAASAIGRQVAMHIAATRPESLSTEDLDPALVEREKQVLIEQAVASGKPPEIAEKMVQGRMRKYYEEVVLLEQTFVIDGESKVKDAVAKAGKDAGSDMALSGFARFTLGEGIEKEEADFAAEVAATLKG